MQLCAQAQVRRMHMLTPAHINLEWASLTDPSTTLELQILSHDVSELHEISRSPDFEPL